MEPHRTRPRTRLRVVRREEVYMMVPLDGLSVAASGPFFCPAPIEGLARGWLLDAKPL